MTILLWLLLLLLPGEREAFTPSSFASSHIQPAASFCPTQHYPHCHASRLHTRRHLRFLFFNKPFARRRKNETAILEEENHLTNSSSREELFSGMFRKTPDQEHHIKTSDTPSLRNATINHYIQSRIQAQEESKNAIEELWNTTQHDMSAETKETAPEYIPQAMVEEEEEQLSEEASVAPLDTPQPEATRIEFFGQTFLLDTYASNASIHTSTQGVFMNESQFLDTLEVLGPLTLSDPAFAIGAAHMTPNKPAAVNRTSNDHSKVRKKPYRHVPSFGLMESSKFFGTAPESNPDLTRESEKEEQPPEELPLLVTHISNHTNQTSNHQSPQDKYLNETVQNALEALGPLTLSDPSFAIGAGNTTLNKHAKVRKNVPSFGLMERNKFFSFNTKKLPPIPTSKPPIPTSKQGKHSYSFPVTPKPIPTSRHGKNTNSSSVTPIPTSEHGKTNNSSTVTPKPVVPSLTNDNATPPLATVSPSSNLNSTTVNPSDNAENSINASEDGNAPPSSNPYYLYDPSSALAFLDSQANFTKQQLEAAQKIFLDYSANATNKLDTAQKALLQYGTKALEDMSNVNANANPVVGSRTPTLSVEELEAYLRLNGYVKQADLDQDELPAPTTSSAPFQVGRGRQRAMTSRSNSGFLAVGSGREDAGSSLIDNDNSKAVSQASTAKGRVAFPQPSILSYAKLKWGSTAASAVLGLLGGITIFPNLWLLGALFGGLYGYDVSKNLAENPPDSALARAVVYLGREFTKKYLMLFDFWQGLWFMYKTGQLSYDYWKRYAALDQQFAIQDKMDAWNARFQKGKENFDKWEQENEVGRKMLAGMRTLWLVEEQSKRKFAAKSRYRVVQLGYDGTRYCRGRCAALYAKRGKALKEMQTLAEGMRQELIDPSGWQESLRPRIAAALAALTFVNLTGALFASSPLLLGTLAIVLGGVIWPTWFSEWLSQVGTFIETTKAKALPGANSATTATTNPKSLQKRGTPKRSKSSVPDKPGVALSWPFMDKKDKERYSFYRRPDGSKRWYRTGGNPWDANSNASNFWGKKTEEEKPWWSLNKRS